MNYTIEYYHKKEFTRLREEWETLEKGQDMTYYQTFAWHEMLLRFTPKDTSAYETVFALIRDSFNRPLLIAPFWIIKRTFRFLNKKGCYFLGKQGWSDYLNFVYADFDVNAFSFLCDKIKEQYGITFFCLNFMKEESQSFKEICKTRKRLSDFSSICVKLDMPMSAEEYQRSLSKSTRQNIRTAINRANKDDIKLEIELNDQNPDVSQCLLIREGHNRIKNKKGKTLMKTVKSWILSKLLFKFPEYIPIKDDPNSRFLTVKHSDTLCAFFNYGIDSHRKEIVVMGAGTNDQYARYSPGIVGMHSLIMHHLETKEIHTVDFTRGNERYKYALGGKEHRIHSISFKI